jgi:hypothetical protein
MGSKGKQTELEEDPLAFMQTFPLLFDRLGLLPFLFYCTRSVQTREEE